MTERIPLRLDEALRRVLQSERLDLHVAMPATVLSYDSDTQTANLRPMVRRVIPAADEDVDEDQTEELPVLPNVPILWPRAGLLKFHFHAPMEEGDGVLVLFCDQDLNQYRRTGQVSDPGVGTRHGLSGAVALPGLFPIGNDLTVDSDDAQIGRDGGPVVKFRTATIEAGGTDQLAKALEVWTELSAIAANLDSIIAVVNFQHGSSLVPYAAPAGGPDDIGTDTLLGD